MTKPSKKALTHHKKVIQSVPVPAEWMFCDFTVPAGNPIEDWVSQLNEDAENYFWSILKANRTVQIPANWRDLRYLRGEPAKHRLWELRFRADKAYRIIGFFSETIRMRAILLIGCTHKQGVYDPHDALNTAITRKRLLEEGRATAHERQIPTDI